MKNPNVPTKRPPRSEWVVAIFGLAILLGVLSVLGYEAFRGGETPPDLTFRVVGVSRSSGGYLVRVAVTNGGGETTAGVTVEGTLNREGQVVETSEASLDYLPGGSVREAGMFFTLDPQAHQLELRALGYQEP